MVDGVNFNPFTNKIFTDEQIAQLDTNKDGIVSDSEMKAQWDYVAGLGADSEGEVSIDSGSGLYGAAKKSGMTDSASDENTLKQNIATLADEYIEQYMTNHPDISDTERTALKNLVTTASNEFIVTYLAENPDGPWDMSEVASEFESNMEQTVANNEKALQSVNSAIDGYKNNKDANYDGMVSYADSASENNNISNAEWNTVKNKAVQYLMGSIMSGEIDTELLQNINPKYQSNQYYKNALNALNKLQSTSDPIEMQKYLTEAQKNLSSFLDSLGKDKVVGAINDTAQAKQEEAISEKISGFADNWVENNITSDMTEEEKTRLKNFASNCVNKFISKLAEEDKLSSNMSDSEIKAQFSIYLDEQKKLLDSSKDLITRSAANSESDYNNLVNISDAAAKNGNVSEEEKENIVDAATTMLLNQMLSGMEKLPFMQGLNQGYEDSAAFKEIKTVITSIQSSVDPEEIKELTEKAEKMIKDMLNEWSGNALVAAVDSTKPIEIDQETKDKAIYNSALSNDYQANVSRSTSRGNQDDGRLEEIQSMARQDLEALATSLKEQLKSELGTAYNETEVDKYIQDAINDTISMFTQNVSRRNGHGDYNTGNDEQAFVFLRRSGTHKGRYVYNVQALTNTFIEKFNENCKAKNEAKNDPSSATYDKENVIAGSLGNEYDRNITVKNDDKAALYATAKAKLVAVGAALKASLIAEGCTIDPNKIDEIINDATMETMNDFNFNTVKPENNSFKDVVKYIANRNSFSVKELVDTFMEKVDDKLDEIRNQ